MNNTAISGSNTAKWTVLAYVAADNNIEASMLNSLLQMERVGSTDEVNVVAQIDRRTIPLEPEIPDELKDDQEFVDEMKKKLEASRLNFDGDWTTARRFRIEKGADDPSEVKYFNDEKGQEQCKITFKTGKMASPVIQDIGETDVGDKKNMSQFLQWGIKNYPAEHYMLVIIDHGSGYLGCLHDENPQNMLSLSGMKSAISEAKAETGKRLDIIGFDACLMGSAEVAYQLKDLADVMIASQEIESSPGWAWKNIIETMKKDNITKAMDSKDVAEMIVASAENDPYATKTLSAIDLEKMEAVKNATDKLGLDLLKPEVSQYALKKEIFNSLHFGVGAIPEGDTLDIIDLCTHIAGNEKINNPAVKEDCGNLIKTVSDAVIANANKGEGMQEAHGLSIYACNDVRRYDPFAYRNPISKKSSEGEFSYRNIDFAKENKWDELLRKKFR